MRFVMALLLAHAASQACAQSGTIASRFAPPSGFQRTAAAEGSFAHYLRHLPVKPPGAPVLLHNGCAKHRQDLHAAVIELSVGARDLQQCADAVMRLRAEHLFGSGRQDSIAFVFTNGFRADWERWRKGGRIRVEGNRCSWFQGAAPDESHEQLLRYLDMVFTYAGTRSLAKELKPASGGLAIGDVFIQGGSPGHAVIMVDAARHPDGRVAFLIAQSYMPAQEVHVLRNTASPEWGAWYIHEAHGELRTPEWTFAWSDRRRWP